MTAAPIMPTPEDQEAQALADLAEAMENSERLYNARQSKPEVTLTKNQLMQYLPNNINGCTFATVHAVTEYSRENKRCNVKSRADGSPVPVALPIRKGYSITFPLGSDYETMRNNELEDNGEARTFKAGKAKNNIPTMPDNKFFGQHIYTKAIYFVINIHPKMMAKAFGTPVWHDGEGKEIPAETVEYLKKNFLPAPRKETFSHFKTKIEGLRYLVMKGIVHKII